MSRDHSCGIFSTVEERRQQAGRFVCEGLRNGEKVLYALHAPTPEKILGDFRVGGLSAEPYLRKGQLEILPASRLYLVEGILDLTVAIARIEQAMDRALGSGFPGFRLAGELTGVLDLLRDIRSLAEYEMDLNSALARGRGSVLCLYPVSDLVRSRLPEALTAHAVLYGGNHLKASGSSPREPSYPLK